MPDKLGPIEIEFVLDKQANEQAKKLKTSLDAVGTSSKKSVADLKVSIKEQKELIKSIEQDVKNLQKAYDNATAGRAKQSANSELLSANKALAEEKGTLLGLQKQQIEQNKEEETSQGKIIESLKKWGMGLLTITGAIKIYKAIIASSNVLTEEFGFVVQGAKGALQQFFQVFSAGAGQTGNPIANMIKGFKGSKELAQNIDLYNDSMRANHVIEAQEIETLKQKEAIFRNASNTAKQRETALNDWIAIRKEAAARELKIEQDLNTSLLNEIKNRPNLKGVTDQEIGGFVTMYAKNPQLMQKAEELSKIYSGMAEWDTADKIAKLRKEIDALLPSGITFESLMSSIRLNSALSDKQIDALADSYKRLATAQGGGATVEAESARWLGSIINKGEAADKKLNDLKIQIDTLKTSLETASEVERKGIAAKIVLLEAELKVREKIVKQALIAAEFGDFVPTTITTGGFKVPSVLPKTTKPTTQKQWDQQQKEMANLAPGSEDWSKKMQKAIKENDQDQIDSLNKQLKLRRQIGEEISNVTMQLAQQLGASEEELAVIGGSLDAIMKAASGDYIGAAMSLVSGLLSLIPNEAEKFALQIDHINRLMEEQQRLIDAAARSGGTADEIKKQLAFLEEKRQTLASQYLATYSDATTSKKKKALEELMATQDQVDADIKQLEQDYNDFLSGGVTQNQIADVIAQGFQDGKTSVDDFADYMNQVLVDAVLNIFKNEILGEGINQLTDQIKAALFDKVLTDKEKQDINAQVKLIADSNKELWDNLTGSLDLTGAASSSANSMTGAIKGVSEETASVLAGQVNNIRISQAESAGIMRQQLMHLAEIAANTRYNKHLESIDKKLDALNNGSLRSQGL